MYPNTLPAVDIRYISPTVNIRCGGYGVFLLLEAVGSRGGADRTVPLGTVSLRRIATIRKCRAESQRLGNEYTPLEPFDPLQRLRRGVPFAAAAAACADISETRRGRLPRDDSEDSEMQGPPAPTCADKSAGARSGSVPSYRRKPPPRRLEGGVGRRYGGVGRRGGGCT